MAATVTVNTEKPRDVMGSMVFKEAVVTLDAASGVADFGLNRVVAFGVTPISVTTGGFGAEKNHTSGNVRIGSGASGDAFDVWAAGY